MVLLAEKGCAVLGHLREIVARELATAGVRSSPGHSWGRFAPQRKQACSPQGIGLWASYATRNKMPHIIKARRRRMPWRYQ